MTRDEIEAIEEDKRLAAINIDTVDFDTRQFILSIRLLYSTPKSQVPIDMKDYYDWEMHLLNIQDPNQIRYAFAQAILVNNPVAAYEDKMTRTIECWFRVSEEVLGHSGTQRESSIALLRSLTNLSYNEAHKWLHILVCVILYRCGWTFIAAYQDGSVFLPTYTDFQNYYGSGYDGVPAKFATLFWTGKDQDWVDLMDIVDTVVYEVTTNLNIADWIQIQIDEYNHRKAQLGRFRTYLILAMAAVVVLPTVFTAFKTALGIISHVQGYNISLLAKLKLGLTAFMDVMGAGFSSFLTAIHYNTLIGIHKIAELVSSDYRQVMRGVYAELSRVSDALGYGPYTLILLTQNSKNLIHDVSSTFGMEWDLSEVHWLSTFQDYMKKFSGAAYKYRDNPEALLYDLSRWVEKDALNAKGAYMAALTQSVDNLLRNVQNFVGDITLVRDDINKLVADLPESIRLQVAPVIAPYITKFDDFITDTYDPYRQEITAIVDGLQVVQREIQSRADELVDRLKKPSDYLLEIDNMSEEDRLDQEMKLSELSNREFYREVDAFVPVSDSTSAELKRIRDALRVSVPMPIGFPEEVEGPQRIKGEKATPRKSWFVGDY